LERKIPSLFDEIIAHLPPKEKLENGNFSLGFFLVVRVVYICGQLKEDDEAGSGDDDKRKKNKIKRQNQREAVQNNICVYYKLKTNCSLSPLYTLSYISYPEKPSVDFFQLME
jgi:hypothetical protein